MIEIIVYSILAIGVTLSLIAIRIRHNRILKEVREWN